MNPAILLAALAVAAPAPRALDLPAVEREARALVAKSFPELAGLDIAFIEAPSSFDYFSTSVGKPWRAPRERVYVLRVNPRLYEAPPEPAAVRAILAHELAHLEGFTRMTRWQLAWLGLRYILGGDGGFAARYERATDERALELGHAEGLKSYRRWLYLRLADLDVARKRRLYYTPEEIDERASRIISK